MRFNRRSLVVGSIAVALLGSALPAAAQVTLDFDWATASEAESIYQGYGTFSWDPNFLAVNKAVGPGYGNGVTSGNYAAANAGGFPVWFKNQNSFHFVQAWFTAAWRNDLTLVITGYRGGVAAYSRSLLLSTLQPTLAVLDFTEVDEVRFEGSGGTSAGYSYNGAPYEGVQFIMDDAQTTVTPEPASMVLLGSGLAGLAAARRRRRKNLEEAVG